MRGTGTWAEPLVSEGSGVEVPPRKLLSILIASMGVGHGGQGDNSPKIWSRGANANCPPQIVILI